MNNQYKLIRKLKTSGTNYDFYLYKDQKGNKYFAKSWSLGMGILKRKHILNEINALKFLMKIKFEKIPKMVIYEISNSKCYFLTKYIDGVGLNKLSYKKIILNLTKAIKSFQKISIKDTDSLNLVTRNALFYFFSFHLIFIKSIFNFPLKLRVFLKSFIRFYLYFPLLFGERLVFTHRDLNPTNIMVTRNKTYIVDYQLFAITFREFEYASIVRSIIRNKTLTLLFIDLLKTTYLKSNKSRNIFKIMAIYYAIMGLSDKKFSISRKEDFFSVLDFIDHV